MPLKFFVIPPKLLTTRENNVKEDISRSFGHKPISHFRFPVCDPEHNIGDKGSRVERARKCDTD